jgi:hypothetical protein
VKHLSVAWPPFAEPESPRIVCRLSGSLVRRVAARPFFASLSATGEEAVEAVVCNACCAVAKSVELGKLDSPKHMDNVIEKDKLRLVRNNPYATKALTWRMWV